MAIVVPKRIYINYQKRKEHDDNVKLGFATYADQEDKPFEKRKSTIDSWADRERYEYVRHADGRSKRIEKEPEFPAEFIDNKPRIGFKIPRHVRRWGWNGGNVLWRVEDPRGFELEIASENMGQMLMHCTIVEGEIQGECVWGWNKTGGSKVVLLPVNSEPYQEALNDTILHNSTVSMKDVNIGDRIVLKNGAEGVFYGKHWFLTINYMKGTTYAGWGRPSPGPYPLTEDGLATTYGYDGQEAVPNNKHFLKLDSGDWYVQSGFKVALIKEKIDTPLEKKQAWDEIDQSLMNGKHITESFDMTNVIGMGEIAMIMNKHERGKFNLVPATMSEVKERAETSRYSTIVVFNHEGKKFIDYVSRYNFKNGSSSHGSRLFYSQFLKDGKIISGYQKNYPYLKSEGELIKFDPQRIDRDHFLLVYNLRGHAFRVDR